MSKQAAQKYQGVKAKLKKKTTELKSQLTNAEREINELKIEKAALEEANINIRDTVAKTQEHLKVNDLTKITITHPMPENTSLGDLIEFYNNPPQNTLDSHVCPPTCSETYHQQLQQAVMEELNTHLGLGLKEPT